MTIDQSIKTWFEQYFSIFRDYAPMDMVEFGGYQLGKPTGMASSLESCIAFANIVADKNATILDAGAGASTWVLRKLFPNVISTDPDPGYLEAVKKICARGGLYQENFIAGLKNVPVCDYCYYDYGNIQRMPSLAHALSKTRKKAYVDDTDDRPDCAQYREFIYQFAKDHNLQIMDCRDAIDRWGRWGVIITI